MVGRPVVGFLCFAVMDAMASLTPGMYRAPSVDKLLHGTIYTSFNASGRKTSRDVPGGRVVHITCVETNGTGWTYGELSSDSFGAPGWVTLMSASGIHIFMPVAQPLPGMYRAPFLSGADPTIFTSFRASGLATGRELPEDTVINITRVETNPRRTGRLGAGFTYGELSSDSPGAPGWITLMSDNGVNFAEPLGVCANLQCSDGFVALASPPDYCLLMECMRECCEMAPRQSTSVETRVVATTVFLALFLCGTCMLLLAAARRPHSALGGRSFWQRLCGQKPKPIAEPLLPIANEKQEHASVRTRRFFDDKQDLSKDGSPPPFARSNFKHVYALVSKPCCQHEVMDTVWRFIMALAAQKGIEKSDAKRFFDGLQDQLMHFCGFEDWLTEVPRLAVKLWTSTYKEGFGQEFCKLLNEVIRSDQVGEAFTHAMVIVKLMNTIIVTDRVGPKSAVPRMPMDAQTFRGTFLPWPEVLKFTVGLSYRCQMFLATSFEKKVAYDFLKKVKPPLVPVLFFLKLDDDLGCDHAMYLADSIAGGEEEYLYAPYSVFTVLKVDIPEIQAGDPAQIQWSKPVLIWLKVAPNNKAESEDFVTMPWH